VTPLTEWLQQKLGISPLTQAHILSTVLVVLGLWLLRKLVLTVAYRRVTDPWSRYRWRKTITYLTIATGILVIGRMWFVGLQALATFLGLLTAGLAIALRDPISDLAAWLFIMSRRPFEVGDRIQIGTYAGDVIDVRLFHFTLNEIGGWVQADQATGRIVHVPNGRIFSEPVANYDKGFKYIWNEVPVLVTFDSNWKRAKEILLRITMRHAEHLTAQAERELLAASQRYLISYKKLTPIVYTKVVPTGIQLTIRYLIEPRKRRGTEHAIWEDVLSEFAKTDDIELAFMTTREEKAAALRAAAQSIIPSEPQPPDLPRV
jgi:small-conductance mechanosensitive channel